MVILKRFLLLGALAFAVNLAGCFTPVIEGATEFHDSYKRDAFEAKAAAGDPVAQYKLGNTYCCHAGGPLDTVSIYNNAEATHWYCRAARKDYGPAQLRLAQIYAGHPIQGFRVAQHVSAAIGSAETDLGVALMWASVAADQGVDNAEALRTDLTAQATPAQHARSAALMKNWRTAPCGWNEVFPSGKSVGK